MSLEGLKTLNEIKAFLDGTHVAVFEVMDDKQAPYAFIKRALSRFAYGRLKKDERGIMVAFLQRVTGYSRQQITSAPFIQKYTKEDILRLSKMDEWHETPSGGVMKKLFERAHERDSTGGYERLATISVSHLYNLRKKTLYLRQRHTFEKTKPVCIPIGERRKPVMHGMPGYLRIDTVHQGDLDGVKGVYYINAVDEVTQFEIVVCVQKIYDDPVRETEVFTWLY